MAMVYPIVFGLASICSDHVGRRWAARLKRERSPLHNHTTVSARCTLHAACCTFSALWVPDPSCAYASSRLAFLPTPAFRFRVLPRPHALETGARMRCVLSFRCRISFHFISGAAANQAIPTRSLHPLTPGCKPSLPYENEKFH